MKKYVFCFALLIAGTAHADELANANALYAKKSYPQAIALYSKLAKAGNADAQYRLSEIYQGSEAGPADSAKADEWLRKAAAKGNKDALASLERSKQREGKRADVEFWMSKYDGQELRSGKYACPPPRFPALSKENDEIDRVSARMAAWEECFNAAAANLNASSPLTQRIPKEVSEVMTKEEMEKAKTYLAGVHSSLAEEAKVTAKLVVADYDAWRDATNKYVNEYNRIVKDIKPEPKD